MEHLIINSYDLADYGVYVSRKDKANAPKRRFTTITVPGRNGDLIQDDESWENIEVSYSCYVKENSKDVLPFIKQICLGQPGYLKIEDTVNPYEYRFGAYSKGLDDIDTSIYNKQSKFTLTFNCKPQRYLKTGQDKYILRDVKEAGISTDFITLRKLYGPASYPCSPILFVTGNSEWAKIKIGVETIDLKSDGEEFVIDTETLNCINSNGENRNNKIRFSFDQSLKFSFKDTDISVSTNITKLVIQPRWFML